jgi:class 3 adenylate cyclase
MSAEAKLWELLGRRAAATDDAARAAIEAEILVSFTTRRAIVFTDMSGFSKLTRDKGIVHFLGLIHRKRELTLPIIRRYGGHLVKTIGDDLVLTFESPTQAVRAGVEMRAACQADAETRAPEDRIRIAVGIGYGDILDLDGCELYGDEVNRASKLGEDIAEPDEVLVTRAAAEAIDELKGWWLDERTARISGITFDYFAVERGG